MDILIQNTGSTPLMVPVKAKGSNVIDTLRLEDNMVVKIPKEVYEECILTSSFFRQRIQDGVLRVLNANTAEDAVKQAVENRDYAYSKYVDMMKKIKSVGGVNNADIRQHLNEDGTPTLQLLNVNFGRNIDPTIAEEFRVRYLAEESSGLHADTLRIPGGVKLTAGSRDVEIKSESGDDVDAALLAELDAKEIDELKAIADERGIVYPDNVRKRGLIKLIMTADV